MPGTMMPAPGQPPAQATTPAVTTPTGMTSEPTMAAPAPTIDPACGDVPTQIFGVEGSCGGIACHGTPAIRPVAYVDLGYSTADLNPRLLDLPGIGSCEDFKVIDTQNVENSLMITKLSDTPPCGEPMPFSGGMITDEQRECIKQWVRAQVP